jgi:hypothetical protein
MTVTAPVREALQIRQEAAKSSVAKLEAATRMLCENGKIYDYTQFYGAPRTGRWAGRDCRELFFRQIPDSVRHGKTAVRAAARTAVSRCR